MLVGHLEGDLTRLKLCDETELLQIGVALREALVNAIYHGNLELSSEPCARSTAASPTTTSPSAAGGEAPYRDRRVRVTAVAAPPEVRYVIADEGPGFDPSALPDPRRHLASSSASSGRGLLLIRTFMDEVQHNARGNEITLRQAPPPPLAPSDPGLSADHGAQRRVPRTCRRRPSKTSPASTWRGGPFARGGAKQ